MTNEPKTRTINNDRTISSLFPTRFIKPAQLIAWKVTSLIVTISRMVEEEVQPKPGQTEWKPVLYFLAKNGSEHPQGYLLSAKADADALIATTGSDAIAELPGKQIKITLAEYRRKSVLRIDPDPIQPPAIAETRPEVSDLAAEEEDRNKIRSAVVDAFPNPEPEAEEEAEPESFTDSPQGEEYGF